MAPEESQPSAWEALSSRTDLVTPMAVRVAATLRLADLIAGGAEHVDELAERSGTDPDALGRMLRHLTCHGIYTKLALAAGLTTTRVQTPSSGPALIECVSDVRPDRPPTRKGTSSLTRSAVARAESRRRRGSRRAPPAR